MSKIEIYTSEGWVEVEEETHMEDTLHGHLCNTDCGSQAEVLVNAGSASSPAMWAQCSECARESACESQEAAWFEEAAYGARY
jgi:hypothetical protein